MRLIQKIVLFIFANASTAAVVDVPVTFRALLRTGLFATVAGQLDYAFIAVSVLYGVSHAAYQNSAYPVHLILFQSSSATLLT